MIEYPTPDDIPVDIHTEDEVEKSEAIRSKNLSSPIPQPIPSPRLTVVEKVYHQIPGENTKGPPQSRYYRWLESDEQCYTRTLKVGIEWQPLDLGWLKNVEGYSLLKIINVTKRLPSLRPSDSELEEFYSRILEVGIEISPGRVIEIGYIPVGEDMRLAPLNIGSYRIRCRAVETKYTIYLVPM